MSLSPISVDKLADGIVTWKLVALMLAREFKLIPGLDEVPVVPVVLVVEVVEVFRFSCNCSEMLVGGLKPSVRDLSLLTSMTAISTSTSGCALSRSSTSFCASAIWSGVPRTTTAFCDSSCCTRCTSSTERIAFTTSCNSDAWDRFDK